MKNHYGTLGVGLGASHEEIKSAYRLKSREHHPDISGQDGSEFKRVSEAFETLSRPDARQAYDHEWRQWLTEAGLVACPKCGWANTVGRLKPGHSAVCCNCATSLRVARKTRLPTTFAETLLAVVSQVQEEAPDLASDLVRMGFASLRKKIVGKSQKGHS